MSQFYLRKSVEIKKVGFASRSNSDGFACSRNSCDWALFADLSSWCVGL